LLCNQGVRRIWLPPEQKVGGSNPLGRTTFINELGESETLDQFAV